MCLFVVLGHLHWGTPQWTGSGHRCHSLISLQPAANCLNQVTSSRDNHRIMQYGWTLENLVQAAWRTQQLQEA